MIRALLARWREGKALRSIEAVLRRHGQLEEALNAARDLQVLGSKRSIPTLCRALGGGPDALRAEAAAALAHVHKRHPDTRVLEALNAAVLMEAQPEKVRVAAAEALTDIANVRRAGSFVEVLKKPSTPLPVRAAAIRGLRRLSYPEVLERLVENYLFERAHDPHGAIRHWVVEEVKALDDKEKLSKLHEIAHGRRRLRYHALKPEAGDPAVVIHLMSEADPEHAVRFLTHMADQSTAAISAAARKALDGIRAKHKAEFRHHTADKPGEDDARPTPHPRRPPHGRQDS